KDVGAALKAPMIRRSYHANGFDNRSRHRQVHGIDAAGQVVIRRLLILPSLSRPPLECCLGTSPIQAEKLRPERKVLGLPTLATRAPVRGRRTRCHPLRQAPWHETSALAQAFLMRRPTKVAAIALANKLARMAWAMMATGARYSYPVSLKV